MKQIKLTQGQFAIVDDTDYDWLNQWKWFAHKHSSGYFYAMRNSLQKNGKYHTIYMSREILGLKQGDKRQADHQNHNTLDNRRDNLRICTQQQNSMNQKPSQNMTSPFKGVHWYKQAKKWRAEIRIDGKLKHLGLYVLETDAALAYNKAAKESYKEFAHLNVTI